MTVKNIVNNTLAQNIRLLMRLKNIPVTDVAKKANLSRYQVDNILYCRSQNINTIQKIAQALDTPLDDLFNENLIRSRNEYLANHPTPIIKNKDKFKPDEYIFIVNCCRDLLGGYNISLNKEPFDQWVNVLYMYKEMAESKTELRNMAKGILFYLLEYNENSSLPNNSS